MSLRAQHSAGFPYLSSCVGFRVRPRGKIEPEGSVTMMQRADRLLREVTSCVQAVWSQTFYQSLMK